MEPTTPAALNPPEASDLRPLEPRDRPYDRVHRQDKQDIEEAVELFYSRKARP